MCGGVKPCCLDPSWAMKREPFPPTFSAKEPFTPYAVLLKHYGSIIINLLERKNSREGLDHIFMLSILNFYKKLSNPDIMCLKYPLLVAFAKCPLSRWGGVQGCARPYEIKNHILPCVTIYPNVALTTGYMQSS